MAYSAWDKFLAFAAPQSLNALQNYNDQRAGTEDIARFAADPASFKFDPSRYEDPTRLAKMQEYFKGQTDLLNRQAAAPVAATAASYLRDPEFRQDPEALQEFARRPEFWLGATDTGSVPGVKKGTSVGSNPYVSDTISQFASTAQNAATAMGAAKGNPADLAWLATNKDQAAGFDNAQQGAERINKQGNVDRTVAANDALNQYIANTPLDRDIESWNKFVTGARLIPGIDPQHLDAALKGIADRNRTPVKQMEMTVGNGPNSTKKLVWVDMFGDPVQGASVQSTNNPSDRELGLVGGGAGDGMVDVSWVVNGQANSAKVRREDLPGFKASLQAQGVTEIDTIDGPKRASRRETLIKPAKGKKAWAPGGATPAPAAKADPLGIRR